MSHAATVRIKELNARYLRITGHDAYLYATDPGDGAGTRYLFATSHPAIIGGGAALRHMESVLHRVQNGATHDEIMNGKVRHS